MLLYKNKNCNEKTVYPNFRFCETTFSGLRSESVCLLIELYNSGKDPHRKVKARFVLGYASKSSRVCQQKQSCDPSVYLFMPSPLPPPPSSTTHTHTRAKRIQLARAWLLSLSFVRVLADIGQENFFLQYHATSLTQPSVMVKYHTMLRWAWWWLVN